MGGPAALAQSNQPWIDPPADLAVPRSEDGPADKATPPADAAAPVPSAPSPRPSTSTPPAVAGRLLQEPATVLAVRERAAEDLARRYLDFWSAPNEVALETTPDFYAGRVAFHGRMLSIGALLDEKRRFVRRWPERRYRHRPGTARVACQPTGESCTVRSLFDFAAASSARGKRSQGTASLELVMSFEGDRPVIASENSLVRSRSRVNASLEGAPDD
jgi:hypothetical protein